MYRPVIDWMEDGKDHREIGYLDVIDDAVFMINSLSGFIMELIRKEAVRRAELDKTE